MEISVPIDVQGKVVIVTGAARGMGSAYARGFLSEGAKLVAADKSWAGVDALREELASGRDVLMVEMDVTKSDQIDKAYQAAVEKFGTIDVLVNNAAMRQRDLFPPAGRITTLETKDSDWERLFAVNLFGVLKVIRRFVTPMIEKRSGSIINVVSSGILNHPHGGAYTALRPNSREMPYMSSKAALATLSFYLADELKERNVAVNLIIPGHTRTTGFDEQNRARMRMGMRPGRQPVRPDHVVPLALYLASQDANRLTGRMFDAMLWNIEHGLGGEERWGDDSFSYEGLAAESKSKEKNETRQ